MANMLRGMKRQNEQKQNQLPPGVGQGEQKPSPAIMEQVKTVSGALISLAHDPKASKNIHKMLQSGDPMVSVPQAAMTVYRKMDSTGALKKLPLEVRLPAFVVLTNDLVDFGKQAKFFNVDQQKEAGVMESSFQLFIETGLKDKSIDPIKLQSLVEPLMSEQQRSVGNQAAEMTGVPAQVSPQQATVQYADNKVAQTKNTMLRQGGM